MKKMNRATIPDGLVVLTFDDGCKSQAEFVVPQLRQFGFGATFFVNDPDLPPAGWVAGHYVIWPEIVGIHRAGFEIGNHTVRHQHVHRLTKAEFSADLEGIERRCAEHGIPRPTSFCYPGFHFGRNAVEVLREKGYRFARRGIFPEYPDGIGHGGRGPVYDPRKHHPLLVPTTGYAGPEFGFADLAWLVDQARDGKIATLCFHGVPDLDHSWVHTDPDVFVSCLGYLKRRGCTVIAMRDLARYVDFAAPPDDPLANLERVTP
jgi:peptidoglycan/xylan/chitin deacetylase (PgdA/CDA1 family)